MAGSKRISELDLLTNDQLSTGDYLTLVDTSELPASKNKRILVSEIDNRYTKNADFSSKFNAIFDVKSTDNLVEGITNLYYTETRFLASLSGIDSDAVDEGVANLYYTEDRVSANSDVSANTSARHSAITLDTSATDGGLSLIDQDISFQEADATHNGYLSSTKFLEFGNKLTKSVGDIDEKTDTILNNQSISVAISGFQFDNTKVRSFQALVSIEIDADEDLYESFVFVGVNKGAGVWSYQKLDVSVGDNAGVTLSIVTDTGIGHVRYVSSDYTGYVSGKINFRVITTSI